MPQAEVYQEKVKTKRKRLCFKKYLTWKNKAKPVQIATLAHAQVAFGAETRLMLCVLFINHYNT